MPVVIYHNPRCSKSRQTLALLNERNLEPQIIDYLRHPPTIDELKHIVAQLGAGPLEIMRKGEEEFRAERADLASMSDEERIEWLAAHPRVLQRPIVLNSGRARIGRPPEAVLEILDD